MILSDWHFKRDFIAESYFKTIFSGVILSSTVFAEKNTGLTSFFINDLMPCAIRNDHSVAYVDLSNKNIPVTAAVLMALDRVLTASNSSNLSFDFLKGIFLSGKMLKNKDFYLNKSDAINEKYFIENSRAHFDLIEEKINIILDKKKLLIIFDHADELARDRLSLDFLSVLRSLLVSNRDVLKPIYGTSDMDVWTTIFKNTKSPLYSEGASVHKLPALDILFVRNLLGNTGIDVSLEELFYYFKLLGNRPGIFVALVLGWNKRTFPVFSDYVNQQLDGMTVIGKPKMQNDRVNDELYN